MSENQNLKDLFLSGEENALLAFEINKSAKLLDRYEIQAILHRAEYSMDVTYTIAKHYKLFKMFCNKFEKMKKRGIDFIAESSGRRDRVKGAIMNELKRYCPIRSFDVKPMYSMYSNFYKDEKHKNSCSMHQRITNCWYQSRSSLNGCSDIDGRKLYYLNMYYKKYYLHRKANGIVNEPISHIFK